MSADSPVLFLDDDEDLRATLTDLIHMLSGRRCYSLGSYRELVTLGGAALDCGIAILDLNLAPGSPGGLDAYRWLEQQGFSGRIVFLSGHDESHPLLADISRLANVEILLKPLTVQALSALLDDDAPSREVYP